MADRDTQFAGFAKLVVEDLRAHGGFPMRPVNRSEVRPLIERIIARRAYDLVGHCLNELHPSTVVSMLLNDMPDMTELPEVT